MALPRKKYRPFNLRKDDQPGDYIKPDELQLIAHTQGQAHATQLKWAGMINRLQKDRIVLANAQMASRCTKQQRAVMHDSMLANYPAADIVEWI